MEKTPIKYEPYRYIDNAKKVLRENAKKNGHSYSDRKYVRAAGHYAYSGILIALDDYIVFQLKGKIPTTRKDRKKVDVGFYRDHLRDKNKKILKTFNAAYEALHLYAGYDGNLSVDNMQNGLNYANIIIDWVYKQVKNKLPGKKHKDRNRLVKK